MVRQAGGREANYRKRSRRVGGYHVRQVGWRWNQLPSMLTYGGRELPSGSGLLHTILVT